MLAFFFEACYNMRVIKRNARCFRLVTSLSSSFSPLSYMDRAQNRKALCPIHFCRIRGKESGGLPVRKPAAALSFVITRPAQGENIAAPQGGKYFRAVRGKVLPRRKWERGATAGRRAASRTPLRGAGLLSERHCGAPGCFPNATAGRRAYFPNTSSAAFTSALASLQ